MKVLLSHRISEMFTEPVDPDVDECPDYFSIVKSPMDLSTVQRKLAENTYETVEQWKQDVELIWSNALLYNGADSHLGLLARELQAIFETHTQSLHSPPSEDWYRMLSVLCDEFSADVKEMCQTSPSIKRGSPSLTSVMPLSSGREDAEWSWDDIARLGNEIRKIKQKQHIKRLLECLRSMEPQLVGNKKKLDVNLCDLSPSTLFALKEEVDLLMSAGPGDLEQH
jgi:hypothetical protein